MNATPLFRFSLLLLLCLLFISVKTPAQTAAFIYQGRLTEGFNQTPTATYDIKFDLYDADVDGNMIGSITVPSVFVNAGVFSVSLNFGQAAFDGTERYMELSIRPAGSQVARTVLQPRQRVTSAPYAVQSRKATTSVNFSGALTGDVVGTQTATVVATVGGETSANVASGAQIANAATNANTPNTVVRRDASGNFSAGAITAESVTLAPGGNVIFADGTRQSTSVDPSLFVVRNTNSGAINVGDTRVTVNGSTNSSTVFQINSPAASNIGLSDLIARFRSYSGGSTILVDKFRFDQSGGFIAIGQLGYGIIPASGAGNRMMWYPFKGSFRAGEVSSTAWDDANNGFYSWAGGYDTTASAVYSFAFGDRSSATASAAFAAGSQNTASGNYSVALGYLNNSSALGSVALGYTTQALGNGAFSAGYQSIASDDYGITLGYRATTCTSVTGTGATAVCTTPRTGAISLSDASTTNYLTASANNQFNVRAAGGTRIFSNATMTVGVSLAAGGGAWQTISDRNAKENFAAVNSREVLRKVLNLPISTWNYKTQSPEIRHIGAMAQDFYKLFGVGESDKTITTIDPDGVALAAIQGLNEELKERDKKIDELQNQIDQQKAMIEALKKLVCASNSNAKICK